jgi:hypothetical protein
MNIFAKFLKMKKYLLLGLALCLTQLGFSQKKKIAVVSIAINKVISMESLGANAAVLQELQKIAEDAKFDFKPIAQNLHDKIFTEFAPIFPFELVDEKIVLEKQEYLNFEASNLSNQWYRLTETANGYKYLYDGAGGATNEEGMAKMFADKCDGVLFVYQDFLFRGGMSLGGNGVTNLGARVRFALYNKEGKKIFAFVEAENSGKSIVTIGGFPTIPSVEKVMEHCTNATEKVMADMSKKIEKQASKIEKKLNKE